MTPYLEFGADHQGCYDKAVDYTGVDETATAEGTLITVRHDQTEATERPCEHERLTRGRAQATMVQLMAASLSIDGVIRNDIPAEFFRWAKGDCERGRGGSPGFRGRVVYGEPLRKRQPRNQPCICGSGKKAKKCCIYFPEEKPHDVGSGSAAESG